MEEKEKEKEKEFEEELKWFLAKRNNPILVIVNYPYLLEKCWKAGKPLPEEAKNLFQNAITELSTLYELAESVKEFLKR